MTELMVKLKFRFIKIIIVLIITLFIFMYINFDNRDERIFFHENYVELGGSLSNQKGCHLPLNVNPFDESVTKFIQKLPKSIKCKHQSDPINNLTFIDNTGVLRQTFSHFKCKFQFFERTQDDDDKVVYHQIQSLNPINGIPMNNNSYVAVECINQRSEDVYRNTHFWFPLTINSETNSSSHLLKSFHKPSVLILVIESLSRINYLRFMTKTKETLENDGNIVYMKGLTKLADNSFPNMVPFLTGKRVWNHELLNEDQGPYDDWPFLWKKFSKAGYKTALIEDFPTFTLFNYESKGFIQKPTDWYPRPFWVHLFRDVSKLLLGLIPFDLSNCYNERLPKIEIFLQQIKHFIHQCDQYFYPYFGFAFYIEVTHNDFNRVQLIDSHISNFLEESRLQLNNTILILMGDHGNRFGSILQTVVGRIEERMPLFAIRIPKALNEQYPHLLNNLKSNSEKLINWFDLHQLLEDITNENYAVIDKTVANPHHYSPWRESIPDSRTCENSFIPENYCVCDNRKKINISELMVIAASKALVDHINDILPQNKCHYLILDSLLEAELVLPSGSTAKPKGFEQRIEVTISVVPSNAIFRAQLFRTARSLNWSLKGDVNRINKYGNQSYCIHERQLKPLCYCF